MKFKRQCSTLDGRIFDVKENRIYLPAIPNMALRVGGVRRRYSLILNSQVDIREPFVFGVYIVCCAVGVWVLRRYVASRFGERPDQRQQCSESPGALDVCRHSPLRLPSRF